MFSKSKRFLDDKSSCAPPPGHYNPKYNSRLPGPVTFKKSPREKPMKNVGPSVGQYDPKYPDSCLKSSSVKTPGLRTTQSSTSSIFSRPKSSTMNNQIATKDKRKSQSTSNLQIVNKIDLNISYVEENATRSEEYRQKIIELEGALLNSKRENEHLKNIQQESADQRESLASRLEELLHEIDSKNSELLCLQDENKNLIEKFAIEEMRLRQDIELYAEQIVEARSNLEKQVKLNEQLGLMNAQLMQEKEKILIEISEVKSRRAALEEEISQFEAKICCSENEYQLLKREFMSISEKFDAKDRESAQAADQIADLAKEIAECKAINADLLKKNEVLTELLRIKDIEIRKNENGVNELRELKVELENCKQGNQKLLDENRRLENSVAESDAQLIRFQNELKSMKEKLLELQNIHAYVNVMSNELARAKTLLKSTTAESASYKSQYEELTNKIGPFKEQLEMFYAERNTLISMENESELKVKELSDQYANLLTHHNSKQKIRHVIKLKEEILKNRNEITILRKECARSKATAEFYKSELDHLQGKRRFDPKLAFQHNKENNDPHED